MSDNSPLSLILFDVDGTLIDSFAHIRWAMGVAFETCALAPPDGEAIRGIIGLSLPQAMLRLQPDLTETGIGALITAYAEAFRSQAEARPEVSFFPGALETLKDLSNHDTTLLGVATGKSRRGMERIMRTYDLGQTFQTVQVADDHPSKPHPSMIETALSETGVELERAVMIGDTTFDMEMGRAAGVKTIAVSWGYHPVADLMPHADACIDSFNELNAIIATLIGAKP